MAGLSGLDAEKMKLVQDLELEMMTDMYARLTNACHKKCIAPKYREADLQKVSKLGFSPAEKRHGHVFYVHVIGVQVE